MAGASLRFGGEIDDLAVRLALRALLEAGGNMEAAFADIGEYLLNSHRERWDRQVAPDGTPWAPLKPATRKHKRKNRDKILVLEGDLRDLLRYDANPDGLEFGTDRIYGAIQYYGSEESGIEGRHYLGLSDGDLREILTIIQDHLKMAMSV